MLKKALCLAAALTFALAGTAAYGKSEIASADEPVSVSAQAEDAESFAIENEDPQYGKYLSSISKSSVARSGFSNPNLIHNSRFDGMDRVWGIDVSYFQNTIDWKKVKAAGMDFAIIRVGYRGYGSAGTLVLDYKFKENIQGAINAGLEVGVYFYTQAINTTEAVAEADFVLSYIKDYKLDLPVYFDIESVDNAVGRLDSANLTKAQKTALCTAFCDRIKSKGYEAGVYGNPYWFNNMIDGTALGKKYPIWLANYTTQTSYTGVYSTWQYTGSGKIDGISTYVDMNVEYRDSSDEVTKVDNFTLTPNGSKANLTWSAAKNAEKYKVYRYDPSTDTYSELVITKNTSATVTLLVGNYAYCVRGYKTVDGEIVYGEYSDFIYADKSKINGLSATTSGTSAKLTWTAVSGASGYEIYRTNGSSTDYTLCGESKSASYTDSGLSVSTGYSYKVRAFYGSDSRTYGTMSDAVYTATLPGKTSAPAFKTSDSSSITIGWNKLENVSGYQIALYSSVTKSYTVKATVSSGTLLAKIKGLNASSIYKPAVRGFIDYNGKRYYGSYSSYKTCYTAPAIPTSVYATVNPTTVKLTWEASSGADEYSVYRKIGNGYSLVATVTGTSYTFKKPTDTSSASYCVKASRTVGTSKFYSTYSGVTSFPTEKVASPSFVSNKRGINSVSLTWSKVDGASGYRLYKYDEAKKTYVKIKTLSGEEATSYTVSGLANGESCKFKVKAYTRCTSGIIWGSASSAYIASSLKR